MSWIRPTRSVIGERRARGSRRRSLAVMALSMCLALVATPGVRAQDEAGQAFCGLLTATEIKAAFGSTVEASPGYGSCDWDATGGAGHLLSLNASWNEMTMADTEAFFGDMESLTVAGRPVLFSASDSEALLFIDVDPGILMLDALVDQGAQARDPLVQLGELAVGRAGTLSEPPELTTPGPEPTADTVAAAFCGSLTPDEITTALGAGVAAGEPAVNSAGVCEWVGSDLSAGFIYFSAGWTDTTLDEARGSGEGKDLKIGGRPAWYTSLAGAGLMYVALDAGIMALTASTAEGVETETALSSLAEALVARSGSLPSPPAPTAPSSAPDGALESLFPRSVGGQRVSVQSTAGDAGLSGLGPIGAAIADALTEQGLSLADVSVAFGLTTDSQSVILAIRSEGFDAAAALPAVGEALGGSQKATEVAGRAVTEVRTEGGTAVYLHAKDDVFWAVQAAEPALSEILGALP
jgi:hypothetical protein